MKVLTFPTYRTVMFMEQKIEVPLWVKYLAIAPRSNSNNAGLVGMTHKPTITSRGLWRIHHNYVDSKMEIIGSVTNCDIKKGDSSAIFHTLTRVHY